MNMIESICLALSIGILLFFSIKEARENKQKKEIKMDKTVSVLAGLAIVSAVTFIVWCMGATEFRL